MQETRIILDGKNNKLDPEAMHVPILYYIVYLQTKKCDNYK